jgi:hypothetical protein
MDITKLIQERADDAAESAELEKQSPNPTNLAAQIDAYLSDRLGATDMKKLSDEYGPQIDAEMARREEVAQHKREQDEKNAQRIANGVYTDAEERAARQACSEVGQKHPTVLNILKNQLKLLEEVAKRKEFYTAPNLEAAYKFLDSQGAFEKPVVPVQSAEEYKKEHIQDWPEEQGVPPSILQRVGKVLDTFSLSHPEYLHTDSNAQKIMAALPPGAPVSLQLVEEAFLNVRDQLELSNAVQRGEIVKFVDMGSSPAGYPPRPRKYSLMKKLEGMSADEVRERMLNDKNFEAALNNLKR